MQVNPHYEDVVAEVEEFFEDGFRGLRRCGIAEEQVIFDPGIGFGKTLEHNLQLLGNLKRFQTLGRPVLVGVSRKSFIGKLLSVEINERLPAGLACACLAVAEGAAMIRTHDVPETRQAVRMAEAILAARQT
jgi:dihydropteroate synthase